MTSFVNLTRVPLPVAKRKGGTRGPSNLADASAAKNVNRILCSPHSSGYMVLRQCPDLSTIAEI